MNLVQKEIVSSSFENGRSAVMVGRSVIAAISIGYELLLECNLSGMVARIYVPAMQTESARALREEVVFDGHGKPVAKLKKGGHHIVGVDTFAGAVAKFKECRIGVAVVVYDDVNFNVIGGYNGLA